MLWKFWRPASGFSFRRQIIAFRKIHDAQKPTDPNPRDTIMLDTAQDDVTHVSSCLRRFSLFWVSVLGSVSELMTWKHPYRTKTHKSQSSSPTVTHNHRAIYPFYIDYHTVLWNTWFWLVYWWFVGDFSLSPLTCYPWEMRTLTQQRRRIGSGVRRSRPGPLEYEPLQWTAGQSRCTVWNDTERGRSHI